MLSNVFPALLFPGLMLIGIGFVLVLAAAILIARGFRTGPRIERKPFLTRAEVEVLNYLRRVLPEHHVSCQIAMGALLKPQWGLIRKEF